MATKAKISSEVEQFNGCVCEAAESVWKWRNCLKNPGHPQFICAQDFKENQLPKVKDAKSREAIESFIDLTVRLRVHYTSEARPDDDQFSQGRGSDNLRTGTGLVWRVFPPKPGLYDGLGKPVTKKQWPFWVRTARHVVFDSEEAKDTKVDLFFDDDCCDRDGRMKSVWAVEMVGCFPDRDWCFMLCVTCREHLGERITRAYRCVHNALQDADVSGLDFFSTGDGDGTRPMLIISHPHGQAKKITVGKLKENTSYSLNYSVPTCLGSSGAFVYSLKFISHDIGFPPVHSGTFEETSTDYEGQVNYGFHPIASRSGDPAMADFHALIRATNNEVVEPLLRYKMLKVASKMAVR